MTQRKTETNGNKAPSTYLLYEEVDGGKLSPIGKAGGRNITEAVRHFMEDHPQKAKAQVVVIPQRNVNRIKVEVETVKRVKLEK
jgi:hypothetical protein